MSANSRRQRRRTRVPDLSGENALEYGVQFGVDRAGAGQDAFHLDLQEHTRQEPAGVFGFDALAIVDPEAVLGGEVLGRLDTAYQVTYSLLSVIDDLHSR